MNTIGTKGFVKYINHMGNDLMVVNAARVSFNKESKELNDKDIKLIKYLAKHGHWTPFAHPQICLHIKAPFPIRTQFFKHKVGFVENEVSRRYVDDDPEYFYPRWSHRPEGSIKQGAGDNVEVDLQNKSYLIYSNAVDMCHDAYKSLLQNGIAPEQARMVLPLGTYTEWYWTGSLAAYARFYKQRSSPHAQAEIAEYASEISAILSDLFPHSWYALTDCDVTPE
jgi:thymidylate synthase (FAD)